MAPLKDSVTFTEKRSQVMVFVRGLKLWFLCLDPKLDFLAFLESIWGPESMLSTSSTWNTEAGSWDTGEEPNAG